MSKAPFMPLWVSDFLGDTLDLDASEVGAYLLLLMAQWQREGESLPNDHKKLQRVARCGRNWPKVWESIGRYFDTDENGVYSKRLRLEAQNVAAKREVNAQNGARGGRAKALKNIDAELANAKNPPERNSSIPEPEPYNIGGGGSSACAREAVSQPENQTFRDRILAAMGVGPDGVIGPSKFVGGQGDVAEAMRWLELPGITEDVAVRQVEEVSKAKADGPAHKFSYFTPAMRRLSGEMSQPALRPDAISSSPARGSLQNGQPDVAAIMARLEAEGRI